MLNRDVFHTDPEQYRLANQGVAKISFPPAQDSLETLRSELSTFVCDGAYAQGLAKILNAYLAAAGRGGSAPAVWISGFFGSGKSHLASMLAALWTNLTFEDGATAEGLVQNIPEEVAQPLKELRIAANRDKVPKVIPASAVGQWVRNHYEGAHGVVVRKEVLVSNAHPLLKLPQRLRFYEFDVTKSKLDDLEQVFAWPFVRHDRFIITFAPLDDLQADLPSSVTARMKAQAQIGDFLNGQCGFGILRKDARNLATRLLRQAWERHCVRHQLASARLASGNFCWYQPGATREQVRFIDADGKLRRKGLGGTKSRKTEDGTKEIALHWHYAAFARITLGDRPQATIEPHVVFTTDGTSLLEDDKKAHRARRKICKGWYNEQWRTLHLSYMQLLSDGEDTIKVAVSSDQFLEMSARPEFFTSPAGYEAPAVKRRAPKDKAAPSLAETVPDEDVEREEELGDDEDDGWDVDEGED